MERNRQKGFILGGGLLAAFILWTILIQRVDVQPAGVNGTSVGFAAVNTWFHRLTGVHTRSEKEIPRVGKKKTACRIECCDT